MNDKFTITFEPAGISVEGDPGKSLMTLARENGLWVESACGGGGRCRSCLVRVEGSGLPDPSAGELRDLAEDELARGWRRACQIAVSGDCRVTLGAAESALRQSRQDGQGQEQPRNYPALVRFDEALEQWVDRDGNIYPGSRQAPPLGLACDLGTTNIAAVLMDLSSGEVLGEEGLTNPQVYYGADVISRLNAANSSAENARCLQDLAVAALRDLARSLTAKQTTRICRMTVAGNTVMHHALQGLPMRSLAQVPYAPAEKGAMRIGSADIGLELAPGAELYTPPNIAGFVGGDHVAVLADLMAEEQPSCWAMVDIGTNTEIALHAGGELYSASCASGPAFEAGHVSSGMRAAAGAVAEVELQDDNLRLHTIEDAAPIGICGSGIITLTAELCRQGLINRRGRLELKGSHVRERGGTREFLLHEVPGQGRPVVFNQQDVRSVQLAKGAIMTGLKLLLEQAGATAEDLQALYVAGTFGTFIRIPDAIAIGMLPDIPRERIHQIGNASKRGAARLLSSAEARRQVDRIAAGIHYVELAAVPNFQRTFIRCNQFQEVIS